MRTQVLLDDVTSATSGPVKIIQNEYSTEYGVLQVEGGSATVVLEGRVSKNLSWVTIDTLTVSGSTDATRCSIFPEMRARVSSYSSGTIRAELGV